MAKRRSNRKGNAPNGYVVVPKWAFWSMKRKVDQLDRQRKRNETLARMRARQRIEQIKNGTYMPRSFRRFF